MSPDLELQRERDGKTRREEGLDKFKGVVLAVFNVVKARRFAAARVESQIVVLDACRFMQQAM